ncbi:hypothetical protein CC2G_007562 [Coprinopsis cinerea AmutBmut pab1-1]|nr:hypothetical protein CC2G_007562 [Coprinopsis cinerea AmutBmut pab1-1]
MYEQSKQLERMKKRDKGKAPAAGTSAGAAGGEGDNPQEDDDADWLGGGDEMYDPITLTKVVPVLYKYNLNRVIYVAQLVSREQPENVMVSGGDPPFVPSANKGKNVPSGFANDLAAALKALGVVVPQQPAGMQTHSASQKGNHCHLVSYRGHH